MIPALEADGLGKRYGSQWALRDCTFALLPGQVTALVGPNGAGKSTLLELAAGLIRPTAGRVNIFGRDPVNDAVAVLPMFGFLGQDRPLYRAFTVADLLTFGRKLNPSWDDDFARERIARLGLDPRKKIGQLSGGQQAQAALVLRWRSVHSCYCWTSQSQHSIRWQDANSCSSSWRQSPSVAPRYCCRRTSSATLSASVTR